jgi:hypothetical protein
MEAATVARRPAAAAAPATAPRPATPKRRPRGRPVPGRRTNPTKRSAPAKRGAPVKRAAPAKRAPAKRAAPSRRRATPARRPAARPHLIPIAVGTAALVKELPDSSLIVRLTQGRAWIGLLGLLLAGIVALNVFTLGLAANAGQIDQNIVALEKENSFLSSRDAMLSGSGRVRSEAGALGYTMADVDQVTSIEAGNDDLAVAVQRLAAAGNGP